MISVGIDGASSCTGVATAVDGRIVETERWLPRGSVARPGMGIEKMLDFHDWLAAKLVSMPEPPDVVTVELGSNVRVAGKGRTRPNITTVRILSRWEAASFLACWQLGIVARELAASSARSKVFADLPPGQKKVDKERVGELIRERHAYHTFADLNETDAAVMALVPFFL